MEEDKNTKVESKEEKVKEVSLESKILEIMNAFVQQEIGNKVTQFNIQGLTQIILSATKE